MAGGPIFSAPEAQFGQPEIRLGVIAPAASVLLPYRVSQPVAEDLLLSGRSMPAGEAAACGLVQALAVFKLVSDKHKSDKHKAAPPPRSTGRPAALQLKGRR